MVSRGEFSSRGQEYGGVEGGGGIYELNELHENYKVARERRRINAGQTSVTVYAYGRGGVGPRAELPRGEPGCVNPRNIRTYAPTSIDGPSPDPRGLIFRADIH